MNLANEIESVSAGVGALAVVFGGIFTLGRFRGVVDANTKATERLTEAFDKHADKVGDQLADHETRISVLEAKRK